mgnify:CR=1 FL=1
MVGAVQMYLDISERKRAEEALGERNAQFELAQKAARVGCYTYDISAQTMRFSRASAASEDVSDSILEVTADQWRARVHRDDFERLRTQHIRAFKERRREIVDEFRFVRPGGEVRWKEVRSLIAYDHAGRAERMTGVFIDITDRRKAEDQKNLLIAELDHRVKNVLACVAAVAQRSRECSSSADGFLEVLNGRINSLANTHALLSRSHWEGSTSASSYAASLPFAQTTRPRSSKARWSGLPPEATQPLAMVLHELATNAAKYGALPMAVAAYWFAGEGRRTAARFGKLVLEWRETGGPPMTASNASGFGTSVIRDLIPYELGGAVEYELAREGCRCRLEIPGEWLSTITRARSSLDRVDHPSRARVVTGTLRRHIAHHERGDGQPPFLYLPVMIGREQRASKSAVGTKSTHAFVRYRCLCDKLVRRASPYHIATVPHVRNGGDHGSKAYGSGGLRRRCGVIDPLDAKMFLVLQR